MTINNSKRKAVTKQAINNFMHAFIRKPVVEILKIRNFRSLHWWHSKDYYLTILLISEKEKIYKGKRNGRTKFTKNVHCYTCWVYRIFMLNKIIITSYEFCCFNDKQWTFYHFNLKSLNQVSFVPHLRQ